jgi:methyltransferase
MIAFAALVAVLAFMVAEQVRSRRNERMLRRAGAVEPGDDVYRAMAWVYPLSFVAMGVEGLMRDRPVAAIAAAGVTIFLVSKALKYWAITTLGPRWTFRVLVPAQSTLISKGPYAYVRHPNYVAVFGEIIGYAFFAGAILTGVASVVAFGLLVRRRIAVEERALGISDPGSRIPDPGRYT